jgi:hypothetical protein
VGRLYKCHVRNAQTSYFYLVKSTNKAKYLGVTITNDLTWNHHINNITNKVNASLRFIKRNVKTNSIKTKELAYKTYVRPHILWSQLSCKFIVSCDDSLIKIKSLTCSPEFTETSMLLNSHCTWIIIEWPLFCVDRKSKRNAIVAAGQI